MHRLTTSQTLFAGVALDLALVVALTVLGALRVLPGEALLPLLGALVGAQVRRSMNSAGGPGGPTTGTSAPPPPQLPGQAPPLARVRLAEFSTTVALALFLFGWLLPHHAHGEA